MANLISNIFYAVISCLTLPNSATLYAARAKSNHKLLFVFGDSLFDPGNNIYLDPTEHIPSYFYPYGMSLKNHSTGRFSDGLVVPDYIALSAKLHIIPPFLKPNSNFVDGASFASAGAGALEIHANAMNLKMQITNLMRVLKSMTENLGHREARNLIKGSVYLFSLGGDDYFNFATNYPNATDVEMENFVSLVIGNLTKGLKDIYAAGGRKFAFQNVAPIGCLPMMKQTYNLKPSQCAQKPLQLAREHNNALSNALEKLESNLKGFKYSIFDYFTEIGNMIDNPSKYGFKVGKVACCGSGAYRGSDCGTEPYELCNNPNEYVFFDGGHTTQHTNFRLSQLMWNGKANVTWPYNVHQLFQLP
ncbi:hypothetical protein P3X46_028375 [Hevea brasiliensis]|uniref:GDSL esterase/lipase 1-like n=2 Tax=Hevea brasiliensis TaxID=3981 RepID=A0ABQ9KPE4_HEVBR|nr:hypothetical protein P3X46_028375 [Hevea brasiliensis]